MISQQMAARLNEQVQKEWESEFIYLKMMAWCYNNHFDGFGHWFHIQANEEREHGMKLLKYLSDSDQDMVIPSVQVAEIELTGLEQIFDLGLAHEMRVTRMYHDLVDLALSEKDHTTNSFLQWFVNEQLEEEVTFRDILNKLRRIKGAPGGLFYLESKLAKRA